MQRISDLMKLAYAHRRKMIQQEGHFLHTHIAMYTSLMDAQERREQCAILADVFHMREELKPYEFTALLDYVMHTAHDMRDKFLEMLSSSEIFYIMEFIKEKREPLFHSDSYSGPRLGIMAVITSVQSEKLAKECKE